MQPGRLRAGRFDADAAARPRDLPVAPQDALAQGQRGARVLRDRAAVLEGPDPDDVRQRDLPGARQLRRRGRLPLLLRQERQGRARSREAALLAGIVQRPEDQSPFRNPALARARRSTALRRMRAEGYITDAEQRAAEAEPLPAAPSLPESIVGPYFSRGDPPVPREDVRREGSLPPGPARRVDPRPRDAGLVGGGARLGAASGRRAGTASTSRATSPEPATAGLDAYVDPSWDGARRSPRTSSTARRRARRRAPRAPRCGSAGDPAAAERHGRVDRRDVGREDPRAGRPRHRDRPEGQGRLARGSRSTRSRASRARCSSSRTRAARSGRWSAARTGRSSKFNRATQAVRQAGSAFKPFVYLTALEQGYTGADTVFDGPLSIVIDPHQPPYRPMQLRRKVPRDRDLPQGARALLQHPGDPRRRDGRASPASSRPRTALGVRAEPRRLPVARARGLRGHPRGARRPSYIGLREPGSGVLAVPDRARHRRERRRPRADAIPTPREVESPQACFQLLQILRGVTARGTAGPAVARAGLKLNIAGKTGTTNDFTDAWFVGMTPRYTVGVWVGNDMKTQTIGKGAEGAKVALPIWIRILEKMRDHGKHRSAGGLRRAAQRRPRAGRLRHGAEGDDRYAPSRCSRRSSAAPSRPRNGPRNRRRSRSSPGLSSSPSTRPRRASCRRSGAGSRRSSDPARR